MELVLSMYKVHPYFPSKIGQKSTHFTCQDTYIIFHNSPSFYPSSFSLPINPIFSLLLPYSNNF